MSSTLNKPAHIRYHLRCLKTFLPNAYTSNDSQRVTLAFFTLCALDLLDGLVSNTTEAERTGYINWIYRCQHPAGGFRGFTGTDLGDSRTEANEHWDPANIAATYFALASLSILGDDLTRVKRLECLTWLKRLQLQDGTFAEALEFSGEAQGGRDMRFCYCAAAIRWILGGERGGAEDIEVDRMMRFFEASQTYEGGFANEPFLEAHAGWTSCAVGAMSLLGRLPDPGVHQDTRLWPTAAPMERLLGWLVSLQTSVLHDQEQSESVETGSKSPAMIPNDTSPDESRVEPSDDELQFAGLTGRCNKAADTCYAFWAGGSLKILNSMHLVDQEALCQYLLSKTQHKIGGFGKLPGDPPDIMHSCLGLSGLACMRHADLKPFDPSLCVSHEVRDRIENLPFRYTGDSQ